MPDLHRKIMDGKFNQLDFVSEGIIKLLFLECQNLINGLLEVNPSKRLTCEQILRHPWFEEFDPNSKYTSTTTKITF